MNSHLTAMSRTTLPVPVRWLLSQGMVHGRILDYGCGKCKALNNKMLDFPNVEGVVSYDPHWHPAPFSPAGKYPIQYPSLSDFGLYDVILCTYVLCTVDEHTQTAILSAIKEMLKPNGVGFISVRNDRPRGGWGVSSKGTLQRKVELDFLYELRRVTQYRIYLLTRESKLG